MQHDPLLGGEFADPAGGDAVHVQQLRLAVRDRDGSRGGGEHRFEPRGVGRAHPHRGAARERDDVGDRRVGDHPPAAEHDDVVGGLGHLAHQVRREEDGAALPREAPGEVAHPDHALRIEAVDRLVEDEGLRIAQQGCGDAESLAHAEREAADPLAGHGIQSGEADDLVDARPADAVRRRDREQVRAGAATRVHGLRVEQDADLPQRRLEVGVARAVDGDAAAARAVQPDDHAHRRRLAGAVRPEEAGHHAGPHGERHLVDGGLRSEPLGQGMGFDHDGILIPPPYGAGVASASGRGDSATAGATPAASPPCAARAARAAPPRAR